MSQAQAWAFPESLQPKADASGFDLARAHDSIVLVRSLVPDDAFTARVLGTERGGHGVVIREDGLILTIGYLITEANSIWLTTNRGEVVPGWPLAYDQATGFGLIQPLAKLDASWIERGSIADVKVGDEATVIGHGGRSHSLVTNVIDKREFAGYWEYLLDEALFTSPAHPEWSGAPLLDRHGKLIGIGSLLLQQEIEGQQVHTNMFVPIDLLDPVLDDLAPMLGARDKASKAARPAPRKARPWLGMYTQESEGSLIVGGVAPNGPAAKAGVQEGDLVLGVAGNRAHTLAEFFRMVWKQGPAGVAVPLSLARQGDVLRVIVRSADRNDFLKKPEVH
jgi:S1-C subfamily serine protease